MIKMFHVKQIVCVLLLLITFFKVSAQGSISMSTNVINYNLPKDIGLEKLLVQSKGYSSLSEDEQYVSYYLNYARKNPSIFLERVINAFALGHPEVKSPYIKSLQELFKTISKRDLILPDSVIGRISKSQAKDLESHQMISHTSSNGKSFQDRVGPYLKNCCSEAIHASPRFTPLEAILMLLFDFNVPDLGHRKALLNVNFTKAGFGVALSKKGNSILVIDFSCQ